MKQDYIRPSSHPASTGSRSTASRSIFAEPFARPERRRYLLGRLEVYLRGRPSVQGSSYELWIDGSFTTEKEEPGDIDLLFVDGYAEEVNGLDEQGQQTFKALACR